MWWTPEREAYAVTYLITNGALTPYGAAGLVSRWVNVEAPEGPASRGGYMGRAWGIGQWLGARLTPIDGNPNFDAQLAYVIQELQAPESPMTGRAYQVLRSAQDADTAARGASMYERAGGFSAATGRDNYTDKTARGVPIVLANWQAATGNLSPTDSQNAQETDASGAAGAATAALSLGTILALAGGLLLLGLLLRK